jgi:hypothetical protein
MLVTELLTEKSRCLRRLQPHARFIFDFTSFYEKKSTTSETQQVDD